MGSEVFETSSAIRGLKAQMADEERALLGQRATSNRHSAHVLRVIAVLGIPPGLAMPLHVYPPLVREIPRRAAAAPYAAADAPRPPPAPPNPEPPTPPLPP